MSLTLVFSLTCYSVTQLELTKRIKEMDSKNTPPSQKNLVVPPGVFFVLNEKITSGFYCWFAILLILEGRTVLIKADLIAIS